MGLIKAAVGARGGVGADRWREYFYCDVLPEDVLVTKGRKHSSRRSGNTTSVDNIISDGAVIAIAEGQCMLIVEQGRVVDVCAEPGEYIYDMSTGPSIFYGKLGENILETFKSIGKRFTFKGEPPKYQRVYYFNTKEIPDNKFGTPTPVIFEVVNRNINMRCTVKLRFNGVYTYVISDPLLFYTRLCGNVEQEYTREQIDRQLKADFINALQPSVGALAELEPRPAQIPARAKELKLAMNTELQSEWGARGVIIQNIVLNPITMNLEDMQKIQEMEDAAIIGSGSAMMTGGSKKPSPKPVAGGWTCTNCGTAATGNFCRECGTPKPAQTVRWICACGTVNKDRFCPNCGTRKPAEATLYRCDKCGWVPEDPRNPPRFCPECGDPFNNNDKQ